jgi:hypothetical protein
MSHFANSLCRFGICSRKRLRIAESGRTLFLTAQLVNEQQIAAVAEDIAKASQGQLPIRAIASKIALMDNRSGRWGLGICSTNHGVYRAAAMTRLSNGRLPIWGHSRRCWRACAMSAIETISEMLDRRRAWFWRGRWPSGRSSSSACCWSSTYRRSHARMHGPSSLALGTSEPTARCPPSRATSS